MKKIYGIFLVLYIIVPLAIVTKVLRAKMNKFSLYRCCLELVVSVCAGR